MTKGQIEEQIRTELSHLYKHSTGRGASQVQVDIVRNTILLQYRQALLPVERTYLSLLDGEQIVREFREKLLEANRQAMVEVISRATEVEVLDLWGHLHIPTGTRFGLVLLAEDLEAKLNQTTARQRLR